MRRIHSSHKKLPSYAILLVLMMGFFPSCAENKAENTEAVSGSFSHPRIGVLLVSHGSRSVRWREMLVDVEEAVRREIMDLPDVTGLKTAFMEFSEPSIATQLKVFDDEGVTDIIIVPLLLRVSSHSFDDIPTIIGQKEDALSVASLRSEGIARYKPRAQVTMTPLLDYPALLRDNVTRRVRALSSDPENEGIVLVAYGSQAYNTEWESLLTELSENISSQTAVTACTHAWCGHLVHYSRQPTIDAISEILTTRDRVLVIPLLVAEDDFFQGEIIGGAVQDSGFGDRVVYRGDSVLPDENLNNWIVDIVTEVGRDISSPSAGETGGET